MKTTNEEVYNDLNKLFNNLNNNNVIATNKDDICQKTNQLICLIDKLKRRKRLEKFLFRLGVFLLIIGLIILFWTDLRIYFVFLIRFIFSYVNIILYFILIYINFKNYFNYVRSWIQYLI